MEDQVQDQSGGASIETPPPKDNLPPEYIKPETQKTDFTDKEAFETLKPKLTRKYGEEVVSKLSSKYAKGLKYDLSVREDTLEEISEEARFIHSEIEADKTREKVYAEFKMEKSEAEKAIKEIYQSDSKFKQMIDEDPSLLNKPSVIKTLLTSFEDRKRDETVKLASFGQTAGGQNKTAYERKKELLKQSLEKPLSVKESAELTKLLKNN